MIKNINLEEKKEEYLKENYNKPGLKNYLGQKNYKGAAFRLVNIYEELQEGDIIEPGIYWGGYNGKFDDFKWTEDSCMLECHNAEGFKVDYDEQQVETMNLEGCESEEEILILSKFRVLEYGIFDDERGMRFIKVEQI